MRPQPVHAPRIFSSTRKRFSGTFHVERLPCAHGLKRMDRESHIVRLEQALLECQREGIRRVETKEYTMTNEKRRLGRGLGALIGDASGGATIAVDQSEVGIDRIDQNPNQPRKTFDEDELAALSES